MALIADAKGKYKRLKVKDSLDGWQITDIKPDRLLIEQGEFKEDLSLLKKPAKGASPTPTGTPAMAPPNVPPPQPVRPASPRPSRGAVPAPPPIPEEPVEIPDDMGEAPPEESGNEDMNDMGDMGQ